MTNEQITQNVIDLMTYKAKAEEEHETFRNTLQTVLEEVKATKSLAEDVHIMAINMKNMQKGQDDIRNQQMDLVKKIDALSSKEFLEYKENKKIIKDKIINNITGSVITLIVGVIIWVISNYMKGGM
jgi:hypothetical protein